MLGNTPRRHTVIALEARKSFAFGLRFLQAADNVAVDLTGATIRLVVAQPPHRGGAAVITKTASLVDAALGLAQIELQAAELDLAEAEYPFDVTLLSANGYSTPVMKGVIDLRANTDLEDLNVYAGINPSTNLAVYLEQGDLVEIRVDKIDGLYVVVSEMIAQFEADTAATNAAHTTQMNTLLDQASGHQLLAEQAAADAEGAASAAAASAAQAEAVVTGDLDPKVAALVNNPASVTNDAIEALAAGVYHDDRYYTEAEVDALIAPLPTTGHSHDDRYYTETEIDTMLGNVSGGAVVQAAEPVLAEGEFWYDTDDDLPAGLDGTGFRMERSGKDANKIFTIIEYFRTDGTKALRSELSGGSSPTYTTRTVTEYAADGITAVLTTIYTLTYDGDGDLVSEVFA